MVASAKFAYLCFLILLGLGLSSSFRVLKPASKYKDGGELNHQLWELAAGPLPPVADDLDSGELYHQTWLGISDPSHLDGARVQENEVKSISHTTPYANVKSSVPPRIESSHKQLEESSVKQGLGERIGISTGLGGFGIGVGIGEGTDGTGVVRGEGFGSGNGSGGFGQGTGYGGSGSFSVGFGQGSAGGGDGGGCPRACYQCSQSLSGICCPYEQLTGSSCPSQCFKCGQSPNGICCPYEVIKQLRSQRAAKAAKTDENVTERQDLIKN